MLMRSARLLRSLRACGSLPSFITWLALATSPVCSLALRLPMPRPPAPFAPTLATHQDMASGMYGRLASESEEQVQTVSYQADALHARHLSSEQYLDTACGDAASEGPDASPESGHGDRAAPPAVAEVPCLIETVPRSARNGAGVLKIKTSGTPRVRAAWPSTRLPSTRLPTTRGRRLRSCCMQVGDMGLEDGPLLAAQLPKRPPGARYLLSRSDAGTLTVTLPPAGIPSFGPRLEGPWEYVSAAIGPALFWGTTTFITVAAAATWPGFTGLAKFCLFPIFLLDVLLDALSHGVLVLGAYSYWDGNDFHGVPWDDYHGVAGLYAILGCAGAAWFAVRALTTTTLSVGEFQWEYKETVAGVSLMPTCYRQGTTEELDISRDGDKIVLITGLTKVDFGRQNVGALSDKELNWVVDSVQIYQRQITAI